jgi:hypothetical protein
MLLPVKELLALLGGIFLSVAGFIAGRAAYDRKTLNILKHQQKKAREADAHANKEKKAVNSANVADKLNELFNGNDNG